MTNLQLLEPIVDTAALVEWSLEHDDDPCACCHKDRYWFQAHRHHIIMRSYRRLDCPWNLIKFCFRCHGAGHGELIVVDGLVLPKLSMGNILWLKKHENPDEWNRKLLATHFKLPRLQKPAHYYFRLRERNRKDT